jgi:hypothetical protein
MNFFPFVDNKPFTPRKTLTMNGHSKFNPLERVWMSFKTEGLFGKNLKINYIK